MPSPDSIKISNSLETDMKRVDTSVGVPVGGYSRIEKSALDIHSIGKKDTGAIEAQIEEKPMTQKTLDVWLEKQQDSQEEEKETVQSNPERETQSRRNQANT